MTGLIKTPEQIEIMAEGGRRLAAVLALLRRETKPGVTTLELDRIARMKIEAGGDKPAFLHYRPAGARKAYPFTLCASVNDVVVHGQPSGYVLREGDILKLDLGLRHQGLYLDSAITVPVGGMGKVPKEVQRLILVTEESLALGIKEAKPGKRLGDIGYAIENIVLKNGFSVAEGLTGHGIGENMHEDPSVFNFGDRHTGMLLKEGMVIAIEPMVAIGSGDIVQLKDEGYGTVDRSWAAHFEHTIAITAKGPRILTVV
ncbi:MAG: type I methionyl aminopeptidase [Candidatus Pacebacteria bacterium]|nr:type I methionyl aminopeptidase [Candidatus Paceibacterota bacterium]